jgi:hypothetical protein
LTKRGKHRQQAIEECRARYEAMPDDVRRPLLRALDSASNELDGRYRKESFREADRHEREARRRSDALTDRIRYFMDMVVPR